MKKGIKILSVILAVLLLCFLYLWFNNDIGVSKKNIVSDARVEQAISSEWDVIEQTTDELSAMIFYDDLKEEHTFSVYANWDGLSFGYFFTHGGKDIGILNGVCEFVYSSLEEKAVISMNSQRASSLNMTDGNTVMTIELDPDKPFALVVGENLLLSFFDENGNVVFE